MCFYFSNFQPGDLCTFLILSPLVQLPILIFLLLSAKEFTSLLFIITVASLIVMALEIIFGIAILWPKSSERSVIVKD